MEPKELAPQVYIVSWGGIVSDSTECSVYALRGESGTVLIDSGTRKAHEKILQNLQRAGLSLDDIRAVLLTHCHEDHSEGAYLFARHRIPVAGHPRTAPRVNETWKSHGSPHHISILLEDAQELRVDGLRVRVYHTPGHTAGCLSYLVEFPEHRSIFTGDLVMREGESGWQGDVEFDRSTLLSSLEKLATLEVDHHFTGHGYNLSGGVEWIRKGVEKRRSEP